MAPMRSPVTRPPLRGRRGLRPSPLKCGARPVGPGNQGRSGAPLHPSTLADRGALVSLRRGKHALTDPHRRLIRASALGAWGGWCCGGEC